MRRSSSAVLPDFFQPVLFAKSEDEIIAEYERLESRMRFVEASEYGALVNYSHNVTRPVHGWYYFKEGYSSELVLKLFERYDVRPGALVLDPFTGSGTTLLASQMSGRRSVGIEFSPFFAFLARTKLDWWRMSPERLADAVRLLLDYQGPGDELPKLSTFERVYDEPTRIALMRAKRFISTADRVTDSERDFLRLGLAAIVEKVSPARKDGKGLKFCRSRRILSVNEALRSQYARMLSDLVGLREQKTRWTEAGFLNDETTIVHNGDARDMRPIADGSVDFVLYSPPYLNTFDYSEVYKIELWLFDHIKTAEEFRAYRARSLRSHVSTPVLWTDHLRFELIDQVYWYVANQPLWNKHIPAMINGYFDDMYLCLKEQYRVCRPGAKVVCVVGNSSYAHLPVPTDTLLARIAEMVGFSVKELLVCRHLGTSSQQLALYDQEKRGKFLRESAVVLEKPL